MIACLAIDIGGTKIAAALVRFNQHQPEIQQRIQIPTPQNPNATALESSLKHIIQQFQGQFERVSIASTGIIKEGVLTALNPKNLGELAFFPIAEVVTRYTNAPITLLNDAQAAACAEYLQHQAVKNFAFITVSTGVGGGIILNNNLFSGTNGIAGHIGHTLADPNGELCGCGRKGCVESVASGRAIAKYSQQWQPPCDTPEVFQRFRNGDLNAKALVDRSAYAIANLIADLTISLDIQCITLGGSVGLADGYLARVKHFLNEMPAIYQPQLTLAHHAQDAGLIGAAWYAQQ